jgi:phosphoadenosine phosphosulfate reductase
VIAFDIHANKTRFESMSPEEVLMWTCDMLPGEAVFSSSLGAEDQVLFDMISRLGLDIPAFTLDTGRLFQETYDLLDRTQKKYGRRIKVYFPKAESVEKMVEEHGINLFRDSVEKRKMCCGVRKLEPLARALAPYDAWICGLRREQADSRGDVDIVGTDDHGRIKINPLANWTNEQVWDYIHAHDVPYNPLHDKGFPSIGCAGCTRAVCPGESCRAGRWWWEQDEHKECGLHFVNGKVVRAKAGHGE